jgi:DNA-binding response OmpR family regulator
MIPERWAGAEHQMVIGTGPKRSATKGVKVMAPKTKVLVVDDQRDIVDTISFCLEQEGYEVISAFNGQDALEIVRLEQPDFVVLDVMMPKENGYQVSRYIREDEKSGRIPKHTMILMLTARVVVEKEREQFLQTWSGADAFMYKPFDLEQLVGRITEMIEGITAAQEQERSGAP